MIPSMLSIDARLFLPISEQQLSSVLDEHVAFDRSLAVLDSPVCGEFKLIA